MRKFIHLLFPVALLFSCSKVFTQTSVVMKAFNGTTKLNGGSTVPGHLNEIDVFANSSGQVLCAECSKPNFQSFAFMISLSSATISFRKLLLTGTKLKSVDVVSIKGGTTPLEYYKIHIDSVTVESIQESASSEIPTFSV